MQEENLAFDLEWDDTNVLPALVYPDTAFVFHKMTQVTLDMAQSRQGFHVLDIGCGRGIDAAIVDKNGARVVGLEPSKIMISKARDLLASRHPDGVGVHLVRGLGEELPFRSDSFDVVVCKGALDHFFDPMRSVREMRRILQPEGVAIIALANYESLSCKLAKAIHFFLTPASFRRIEIMPIWETPPDHTYKFDYLRLMCLVGTQFEVVECRGVSLLWCFPGWGRLLSSLSPNLSAIILHILDRIAARLPLISDVIVVKLKPL